MPWHHLWDISTCSSHGTHLLRVLHGAAHTVESLWHRFPVFSHLHHGACVKDPVAKEVIKLQADPIPPPLMNLIMKLVSFGGEHSQMLHVSPGETQTGCRKPWENKRKREGERGRKTQ